MNRVRKTARKKITFITGTDTGVGKTLLSALLIFHLRKSGVHALGIKPFSCGSLDDAKLISAAHADELPIEEVSPFYFSKPVAPLAAMTNRQRILLSKVVAFIRRQENRCEHLVVEGCGGILVPLGRDYTVADLAGELECDVVIVARNKLGTINHTLMTFRAIPQERRNNVEIVLMGQREADASCKTNAKILRQWTGVKVLEVPFLAGNTRDFAVLKNSHKKIKKTLARILK